MPKLNEFQNSFKFNQTSDKITSVETNGNNYKQQISNEEKDG